MKKIKKSKKKTKIRQMSQKTALKKIISQGPYFTSNLYGDVICRYCQLNRTNGEKKHKKGCPWIVFKDIKLK